MYRLLGIKNAVLVPLNKGPTIVLFWGGGGGCGGELDQDLINVLKKNLKVISYKFYTIKYCSVGSPKKNTCRNFAYFLLLKIQC